jgi:predicted RNase H-like nuclease
MRLLGIDGCKAGWVVAEEDLGDLRFRLVRTAREMFDSLDDKTVCAIDIPIGLPINRARM